MPTNYQCKGCSTVFTGDDPVTFPDSTTYYPRCPKAQLAVDQMLTDPRYSTESHDQFLAMRGQMSQIEQGHPVGLSMNAPVVQPVAQPVKSGWGAKPLVIKAETAEEKKQREAQQQLDQIQQKRDKEAAELLADAQRLVNAMQTAFTTGGGTKSANFPLDLEYGSKKNGARVTRSAAVIQKAGQLWLALGAGYSYRAPKYKQVWGEEQANFEKLIVMNDASKGKHNYHVTLAGSQRV